MLAESLYPLHARYFAARDSLRSYTPNTCKSKKFQEIPLIAESSSCQEEVGLFSFTLLSRGSAFSVRLPGRIKS
jgi:hypothetical protein